MILLVVIIISLAVTGASIGYLAQVRQRRRQRREPKPPSLVRLNIAPLRCTVCGGSLRDGDVVLQWEYGLAHPTCGPPEEEVKDDYRTNSLH
jgi:hypothetical protein